MKLITWNCNMAFRKKAGLILPHHPDILVVPECEHPEKLKFPGGLQEPADLLWFGKNKNKGLGIFSYSKFRFSIIDKHNTRLKTIAPVMVSNGRRSFRLFAVWAYNPNDPDGQYIEQVWKAIHHYDPIISGKRTILIGDFNSNTIWDKKNRAGNHSNVVKKLEEKGIFSSYHLFHQQKQGKEKHPTLYMYRHTNKPYHIDYCFVSRDFADKISSVEIGDAGYWTQFSDHVPLMITFS